MENNPHSTDKTLEKLERIIDDNNRLRGFDDEERKILRKLIAGFRGLESLGSIAGIVKNILMWLGFMIGTFIAIRSGVIDFIIHTVQGGK